MSSQKYESQVSKSDVQLLGFGQDAFSRLVQPPPPPTPPPGHQPRPPPPRGLPSPGTFASPSDAPPPPPPPTQPRANKLQHHSPKSTVTTDSQGQQIVVIDAKVLELKEQVKQAAKGSTALDFAWAARHRDLVQPRIRKIDQNGRLQSKPYPIHAFKRSEFQFYGVGTALYFNLVHDLGMLFAVLAVLSTPIMIISANSGESTVSSYGVERTTIGNFGVAGTEIDQMEINGRQIDRLKVSFYVAMSDLFLSLAFFFGLWIIKRKMLTSIAKVDRRITTVADFTVMIKRMPSGVKDRNQVRKFFESRFGEVVDVALAFDDFNKLSKFCNRGRQIQKLQNARGLVKRQQEQQGKALKSSLRLVRDCEKKIAKLDAAIQKLRANQRQRQCVAAFVTFNKESSKRACLKMYRPNLWRKLFYPRDQCFQGARIYARQASEPSDIAYENLRFSSSARRRRRRLTIFFALILVGISFAASFGARQYKTSQGVDKEQTCAFSEGAAYDVNLARALQDGVTSFPGVQQRPGGELYADVECATCAENGVSTRRTVNEYGFCFCYGVGSFASTQPANSAVCSRWWTVLATTAGLVALAVFSVVAVNYLMQSLMRHLVRLERHSTYGHAQLSECTKLLMAQFLNTGVVALAVNALRFSDFTPEWYATVGVSIILTMIFGVFSPHIFNLLKIVFQRRKRNPESARDKCKTQTELNELFAGPQFFISYRFAVVANVVFVSLMYSAGMPLLNWTAAATMLAIYWMDKAAFLRLYRKPAKYDGEVALWIVELLQWASVLHEAFAIWMLGSPAILQAYTLGGDVKQYTGTAELLAGEVGIAGRVFQWNCFPHFVFLLVLALHQFLKIWGGALRDLAVRCGCLKQIEVIKTHDTFWAASGKKRLESYQVSDDPRFLDAFRRTPSERQLQRIAPLWSKDGANQMGTADNGMARTKTQQMGDGPPPPPPPVGPCDANTGIERQLTLYWDYDDNQVVNVICNMCGHDFDIVNQGHARKYKCPSCKTSSYY